MKGKWAAGIPPRNFTWVIKDRLAMSERPGRVRPQPPEGPPPGGDHLAAGPGVHPGRLACSPPPTTCRPTRRSRWPACTSRFPRRGTPAGPGRHLPRPAPAPERRRADPHPPGGARRPGNRRGGRLPPVVGPPAQRAPGHHRPRAHDRSSHGPERAASWWPSPARSDAGRRPSRRRPKTCPERVTAPAGPPPGSDGSTVGDGGDLIQLRGLRVARGPRGAARGEGPGPALRGGPRPVGGPGTGRGERPPGGHRRLRRRGRIGRGHRVGPDLLRAAGGVGRRHRRGHPGLRPCGSWR